MVRPCGHCACSTGPSSHSTSTSHRETLWSATAPRMNQQRLRSPCTCEFPSVERSLRLGPPSERFPSPSRCVLGNTTILAEFAGEEEVNRFFAQGQSLGGTTSWQASPGTNQSRMGGAGAHHPIGQSPHWNSNSNGSSSSSSSSSLAAGATKSSGELLWGGVQPYSSLWGPPSGEEGRVMGSPTPINTLLPGDLLSGESM